MYPVDTINGKPYAADGSDLREATAEQRSKYRDASHRKKKKEGRASSCEPSGSDTTGKRGIVATTSGASSVHESIQAAGEDEDEEERDHQQTLPIERRA